MKDLTYNLNGMVAITQDDYEQLLGFRAAMKDLSKRGALEHEEFTTMQQERKIVEDLRTHLEVMKDWEPRDSTLAFHIRSIEKILNTTIAGGSHD